MENIYYGKSKSKSHKVNLMDLILTSLRENGFKAQQDSFGDESSAWIELRNKTDKPSEVLINISFDFNNRNKITGISVFESPIITIVDEDHSVLIANI